MSKLENIEYFKNKVSTLLKDPAYANKFVVISDKEIKGVYDSFAQSLDFAVTNFSPNEFIIQEVISENARINFINAAF